MDPYDSRIPLALTRTEGQALILAVDGREIRVEVSRIGANDVRLAITAPDDVAIWREEVLDR
jgi:sRNA-binding carbon storage regulator CsrA